MTVHVTPNGLLNEKRDRESHNLRRRDDNAPDQPISDPKRSDTTLAESDFCANGALADGREDEEHDERHRDGAQSIF